MTVKAGCTSTRVGRISPSHGVDFGCFVHFKYEGDDVLTVKVFDGTMCRKYYYPDDDDTDDESDDDVKPCIHPL